jgi:hypothetical protein
VGVYLPVATLFPVFLGGLLRHLAESRAADAQAGLRRRERGILFGSGLVGGEGLLGVGIAAHAVIRRPEAAGEGGAWAGSWSPLLVLLALVLLAGLFWCAAKREDRPRGRATSRVEGP